MFRYYRIGLGYQFPTSSGVLTDLSENLGFYQMTQLESNISEKHQRSSLPFTNVWLSPDDKEKLVFFALLSFDALKCGKLNPYSASVSLN